MPVQKVEVVKRSARHNPDQAKMQNPRPAQVFTMMSRSGLLSDRVMETLKSLSSGIWNLKAAEGGFAGVSDSLGNLSYPFAIVLSTSSGVNTVTLLTHSP